MSSLFRSTGIVAISTLASRILGFVRDVLMANFFGATGLTDAFFVAFKIPNLFRRFVAEGALTVSFIPVYTETRIHDGEEEALRLAQKTFTILLILLFAIIFLGEIFTNEIIDVIAFGFKDPQKIASAVDLTRIMFPYLFFVSLVAFAMGILNSHGYFFAPAFAPVLLNIGMITGIVAFSSSFENPMVGIAIGVLVGGILQVILQIPYLIKSGFKLKISIDFKHPGIRKIFIMVLPLLFATAIYQINLTLALILSSSLPNGSITYLYFSDRLIELILGVFIISIGNVILPEMSKLSSTNNFEKLKELYTSSIQTALFIAIPASVALMTIGYPIISVFFMRNKFGPFQAEMTYNALFYASIGISSISIIRITTPTFYSFKNSIIPVISSTINLFIFIGLGYFLMQTELLHAGLTLANSISLTVQMLILFIMLQMKIGKIDLKSFFLSIAKYLIASSFMYFVINYISKLIDWNKASELIKILYLTLMIGLGGTTYFIVCFLLKVKELQFLVNKFLKR